MGISISEKRKFIPGDRVTHKKYGNGLITSNREKPYVHFLPDIKKLVKRKWLSVTIETFPGVIDIDENDLEMQEYLPF